MVYFAPEGVKFEFSHPPTCAGLGLSPPQLEEEEGEGVFGPRYVLTSCRFSSFTFSLSITCKTKRQGQDTLCAISVCRKNLQEEKTPFSVPVELETPGKLSTASGLHLRAGTGGRQGWHSYNH